MAMETLVQTLLGELKELLSDQFSEFKFHLRECVRADGSLKAIPASDLETANRQTTANLIVSNYKEQAVEVTQAALRMIGRNDLVENLSRFKNTGPMQVDGPMALNPGNLK